ncbi:trans-aconitate 2-methyltransferase [Streptomyces sp. RFCAC02]|uniref:trans-aconitate 2-methyltransferase n=1 Tax=Streptomyces sp. RFCAC02 TaxID=2499143 RepID=UPI001022534F|nr:trans-aconitate 2-methyltransferase [Streptomyces sp. RFCAC02]
MAPAHDDRDRPAPPVWDPAQYQRHSGHRTRPLYELLARVPPLLPAGDAPRVADLGCGPGKPSLVVAERFPTARITGYDNSPAMLAEAEPYAGPLAGGGGLDFRCADLAEWRPGETFDLIVSNAALQWVPGHLGLLPDWVAGLAPGGVLAFQVPGNFDAPSHVLMREIAGGRHWRGRLGDVLRHRDATHPTGEYFAGLAAIGCEVDAWETTYLQVLHGDDPVLDWVRGTGLRPVLTALDDDPEARDAFVAEYRDALREAYPPGPHGTLFPFRRVFVVAQKG